MNKKKLCPCGSNKNYKDCCGKFIDDAQFPATAEQLMRSRYTAYSKANIDYIQATMCGKASEGYNAKEARKWAKQSNWLGLEVIKHEQLSDKVAFVEFKARYYFDKQARETHELSEFHLIGGRWFYVNAVK